MSRALYGGAITAVVPQRFVDVSSFRVVADTQEVLCDIDTDQSIVIELLSLVDDVATEDCAKFHFEELARENDAAGGHSVISTMRNLSTTELPHFTSPDVHKAVVLGTQRIAKFNEEARNEIQIFMAIIRVPSITTDIVISLNSPSIIHPESSSAKNIQPTNSDTKSPAKVFEDLLASFKILDWTLFC